MSDQPGRAPEQFLDEALLLLATPRSLGDSLTVLASLVADYLGADHCAIYLLDGRTDELVLESAPLDPDVPRRLRVGGGITGLAFHHGRSIQAPRMRQDRRSLAPADGGQRFESIIAVPVADRGEAIGVYNLQTRAEREFTAREVELLEGLVAHLVVRVVRAAQEREVLRRRTAEVQALNELGQAMNSGLGLDESLEVIASRAAESLGAKGSALRLLVPDGTLALATLYSEPDGQIDTDYEKRIADYVAATGEPIMIDDLRTDRDPHLPGSSLVSVPLVLEDRVVGTLTLFDKIGADERQRRLFSLDDLNMLFAISSQIAGEIEDIRLTGRLQELVRTQQQQAAELRVQYERSRALLESISDGLVAANRDGTVVEANSVARRVLGLGREELPESLAIDDLAEDKPPISSWVANGEQFGNRVITLRSPAGRVAAMANLQPILDEGQGVRGAVLTFREMEEVGRLVNRVIGAQRTFTFEDIIGSSAVLEKTKELARVAAGTSANILIYGETGTGKEVFAQAIHNASAFADGPFLPVNCAAIPRDLIESELFGYVEGAFTGASKRGRLGKFELASGGTLFLDEIGEMPPDVQVKLLRVLQDKTVVRVGGDRTIPVDCRVIAATNRDLHRAVAEGHFRQDLLYRLDVISMEIPPIRARESDLEPLVTEFLRTFAERNHKVVEGVLPEVIDRMRQYDWPGNVRELENAIEHAVAMARGRQIQWSDLPPAVRSRVETGQDTGEEEVGEEGAGSVEAARHRFETAQERLYLEALRAAEGDIGRAARMLGMSRATLYRRMREHGLTRTASDMRREGRS
ncbi:MAG: sigma 54-interacting transcriptional regulator [Gemmatimonadota bacterium]